MELARYLDCMWPFTFQIASPLLTPPDSLVPGGTISFAATFEQKVGNTVVRVFPSSAYSSSSDLLNFTEDRSISIPSVAASRDFSRSFQYFQESPLRVSTRPACANAHEHFDFQEGVDPDAPPTGPAKNCFQVSLPHRQGWFNSTAFMPGHTRVALTYRPRQLCRDRENFSDTRLPVIVLFHGTGRGSAGMSEDLFKRGEANTIFGDRAIIFILEARWGMQTRDWEHASVDRDGFFNTTDDDGNRNQDILFVQALIQAAISQYQADPQRVYFMGHSNGGFAALHVGMALREQVAGIAVNAAGWVPNPPKRTQIFPGIQRCDQILEMSRNLFLGIDNRFPSARPVSVFSDADPFSPSFFLEGNNQDPDVSAAYTCALEEQLRTHHYQVNVNIVNSEHPQHGHHFISSDFMRRAWRSWNNPQENFFTLGLFRFFASR